jgi:hypothetical protein
MTLLLQEAGGVRGCMDVVNGRWRPQPFDRVSPHVYDGLERGGVAIQRRPDRIGGALEGGGRMMTLAARGGCVGACMDVVNGRWPSC